MVCTRAEFQNVIDANFTHSSSYLWQYKLWFCFHSQFPFIKYTSYTKKMLPGLVLGRELDIEFEGQVFETQLMRPMFPL